MERKTCACGCGATLPPDKWRNRPRYIQGHFEASAAGKAAAAQGGRNGRGDAKRRSGRAA